MWQNSKLLELDRLTRGLHWLHRVEENARRTLQRMCISVVEKHKDLLWFNHLDVSIYSSNADITSGDDGNDHNGKHLKTVWFFYGVSNIIFYQPIYVVVLCLWPSVCTFWFELIFFDLIFMVFVLFMVLCLCYSF